MNNNKDQYYCYILLLQWAFSNLHFTQQSAWPISIFLISILPISNQQISNQQISILPVPHLSSYSDPSDPLETGLGPPSDYSLGQPFWLDAALVNNLVPCAWLSSGALEIWRLRLRLRFRKNSITERLRCHHVRYEKYSLSSIKSISTWNTLLTFNIVSHYVESWALFCLYLLKMNID